MSYTYYHEFLTLSVLRAGWLDADQTISLIHVYGRWTWLEAHQCLRTHTDEQLLINHPIYSIFLFEKGAAMIPAGPNALRQLQALMAYDVPQERLVCIVGQSGIFARFMTTAGHIYGLQQIIGKYRFLNTLLEALALIEQDKAELDAAKQTT